MVSASGGVNLYAAAAKGACSDLPEWYVRPRRHGVRRGRGLVL
jgi:hypothetical protein